MASAEKRKPGQRRVGRLLLAGTAVFFLLVFLVLGTWQVQRRAWKLDLIERVESRVHAAPESVDRLFPLMLSGGPGQGARWPLLPAQDVEYLHLSLAGRFLPARSTWVEASTVLGPGFWLLTPLQTDDGRVVLVNRGYVSSKTDPGLPEGRTVVTGLLRLPEPHGRLLRTNQPTQDLWYSRDVVAIAEARKLGEVAPFFVDAEAQPQPAGATAGATAAAPARREPVGGLTVISFPNNHLVYALTWYGLAAMMIVALWLLFREEKE